MSNQNSVTLILCLPLHSGTWSWILFEETNYCIDFQSKFLQKTSTKLAPQPLQTVFNLKPHVRILTPRGNLPYSTSLIIINQLLGMPACLSLAARKVCKVQYFERLPLERDIRHEATCELEGPHTCWASLCS